MTGLQPQDAFERAWRATSLRAKFPASHVAENKYRSTKDAERTKRSASYPVMIGRRKEEVAPQPSGFDAAVLEGVYPRISRRAASPSQNTVSAGLRARFLLTSRLMAELRDWSSAFRPLLPFYDFHAHLE